MKVCDPSPFFMVFPSFPFPNFHFRSPFLSSSPPSKGETDWKVIAIDVNDPRAGEFNDIDDVQRLLPGFTMATYEWFRTYKIPAGKPPNEFAFNGEAKNRAYTFGVIAENQTHWKKLITGEIPKKTEKYDIDTYFSSFLFSIQFINLFNFFPFPPPLRLAPISLLKDLHTKLITLNLPSLNLNLLIVLYKIQF